ncbi:MAG: Aspartate-semialdehyde dehydrogenase [Candidatus Saccharicenans subterraneus]|uniref:Aspartate-semialdehyde dehydrogenase n=1 Tax=Candidatus Saccharicenans subterraneus TaxID=2508984 RepID=A0A3E2BKV3_9BACT|nr:MAG: Aspartate-semialdehyde dehydrogenase [Candidatus Saccharicenans subterraneum]
MSKKAERQLRVALIGTDSLRAQEIKNLLGGRKLPIKSMEFYDPEVAEEYSKLTEFRDEPKVIHHPYPELLEGLDLVFLAADRETNRKFGELAREKGFKAIDLEESFVDRPEVPLVVAGVNDRVLADRELSLVSNPHPVTIFLSRVLAAIRSSYRIKKALSVVLQPVSAYASAGIEELAEQSYALLSSSSLSHKVFGEQIAFNFLPGLEKADRDGFTASESQIIQEVRKVMNPDFDFSLSLVQAPVFHVYSLAVYLELAEDVGLEELQKTFGNKDIFHFQPAGSARPLSNVRVAGQEKIFVGHLKKDRSLPGSYWLWVAADNLTVGSALNALEIARKLFELD